MLNLWKRIFSVRDRDSLLKFFRSFLRPYLEYATVVWNCLSKTQIAQLEPVQRKFTKFLFKGESLNYLERMTELGIESLESRRMRNDLLTTFKIVKGYLHVSGLFFLDSRRLTGGHSLKFCKMQSRTSMRSKFFGLRVVNAWNALPELSISARNLAIFGKSLLQFAFRCDNS